MKSFSKLKNKLKGKAKDVAKAKAGEVSAPAPTGVGRQSLDVSGAANTTDKNPGVLPNKRTMARNTDARYLADNAPVVTSSGSVKVEETRTTEVGDRVQLPESELLSSTSITAGADADSIHVASEPGLRSKTTSLIIRDTRRLQTRTTKDGPARDGLSPQRESSSVSTVKLNQKFNNIADLWSRAYDLLRSQNESLVKTYEEILATEVSEPASGMSNWMTLSGKEREVAMIELIEKQTQLQTHMKWRLRIGSRTIEFQEQFNRIVKLVVLAKDVVTSAVSPSPHAAIAWAGVCIILPLLLNPSSQTELNTDGIEYTSTLISQGAIRERTYLQNFELHPDENTRVEDLKVVEGLEAAMIQVYVLILEFQARTVCQLLRSKISRTARDIFKADDWKALLEKMKSADEKCTTFTRSIDSERLRLGLTDLRRIMEEQFVKLDQFLQDWQSKSYYKTLRVLKTSDYVFNKDKNPPRVPGTCLWFSSHRKYGRWLDTESGLLWVSADPGCGKSVLARFLVDEVFAPKMSSSQKLCYFFFKDDEEVHRSASHALSAILHQLLLQDSDLLKYFRHSGDLGLSLDGLWDAFASCAEDTKIICVLDALDECEEKSREQLLKKVKHYFGTGYRRARNLKIILTSRPWSSIGDGLFYQSGLDKEAIHLMGENDEEERQISAEIECVIRARVLEFRDFRRYKGINDDAHSLLQTRLDSIPNRTYLWVALIFPELQKKAAESKRVLLRIIDSLPRSVDEIYEKILNQSNDFARAQKLLHIVVAAMRPLTVEEMNIALSIQHDDTCFDEIDLTPPASFAPILRELCGLFVYIIDSRIYLAHQTAKDFLQKPTKASDKSPTSDKWKHSLDPKESNKTIAWSCIRYLLLDVFEHGLFPRRDADLFEVQEPADPVLGCVPSLGNPLAPYRIHRLVRKRPARHGRDDNLKTVPTSDRILQKAINRHPFLEYSAKYWSLHSISAEDEEAFLQVTLQLWQIDVPRGALWFAICCSPYYVPRLPAILWRNWCPLAIHSFLGHTKAVQFLLSLADESAESRKEAEVSLRLAIDRGHAGIARQILAAKIGATVDSIFDDFTTPLSCAVAASNLKIVQILFEAGQKVNNENLLCNVLRGKSADFKFQGLSAGIPASLHADVSEIVVLLLREGANINQLSVHGERPLIVAVEFFNFEGVRALLDSDSGEYKGKDRLWQEAFSTNYRKLNLEERLDINAKDVQGNAALHLIRGASPNFPSPGNLLEHEQFDFRMNEQLKIIKYLLAKGADPNIMADNNFTPLHSAVAALQLEIVEELLKHGANIHGRPSQKTPPLHSIFQSLECKAPIGYKPVFKTPCSCKSIHDMLDLLLKNGANIDARTTDGELNSTLHLAVSWNNLLVVDYLLDHGANIEAINKEGYTPLLVAVRYQQYLSVQRLLEHGADINAQDSFKFTSLHWTIFQDDPDMLLLLLRYHPNLNLLDTWSRTALHIAAGLGNQYSTVLLLGAGAEVNLSDERGLTPLHCAIECGFLDTFWILLMAQSPKSAATQANRRGTLGYAYSIKEQPENNTDFAFSDQESEEGSENNIISGRSSQVEPADHIKPDEELPKEHVKLDSRGDLGVRFTRGTTLPLSPSRTYGKSHPHSGRHTLRPKPTFWPPPINDLRASRGGESSINNSSLRADYFLLREDLSDASEGLDIVSDSSSLNEESLAFSKSENGSEPLEGPSSSDDGSQGSEFPSIITGPTVRTFNPLSPTSDTKLEKEEREVYGDDDRSMSDASQETNSPRRSNAHRPRPPPSIHSSEEQGLEENSSGKISERSLSASFGSIHRLPRRSHRTHMGYVYEYDVTGPASRHGPYLHNLNDDYIQDRNGSSSSKSRSNHSPSQTLQESCFMNTGRSCMLFIRKVYSDLLMQRSLNLPGWNRTSRTDFKWILSLLEREKHLFEDSESDSTIENRFLLKYSPSREDNGGSQKAGATKNHYHGENSYQDSQIWLPSSIFHPSRMLALEIL